MNQDQAFPYLVLASESRCDLLRCIQCHRVDIKAEGNKAFDGKLERGVGFDDIWAFHCGARATRCSHEAGANRASY